MLQNAHHVRSAELGDWGPGRQQQTFGVLSEEHWDTLRVSKWGSCMAWWPFVRSALCPRVTSALLGSLAGQPAHEHRDHPSLPAPGALICLLTGFLLGSSSCSFQSPVSWQGLYPVRSGLSCKSTDLIPVRIFRAGGGGNFTRWGDLRAPLTARWPSAWDLASVAERPEGLGNAEHIWLWVASWHPEAWMKGALGVVEPPVLSALSGWPVCSQAAITLASWQ